MYDWRGIWGRECARRPDGFFDGQIAPEGKYTTWLLCAGRGYGKTRAGAEWVQEQVEKRGKRRGIIVAATAADIRDTIVEGPSGVLAVAPPWFRPKYLPSKSKLIWPNGAQCILRSAEKPDRLRGPQYDFAWGDELASWRFVDAYDQIKFGLRLGKNPQAVFTTTPRPTPLIIDLFKKFQKGDPSICITKGDTFANRANLAKSFIKEILEKYDGTRLGMQELYAELLLDTPGALWKREALEKLRCTELPRIKRVVIGVDPSVTAGGAETGIVVVGMGVDNHGYVLADRSIQGTPHEWAVAVMDAVTEFGADCVVCEVNNGGDLVESNIMSAAGERYVNIVKVRASRGKYTRAEPISGLYEQCRMHHFGFFGALEDQQTTWTQGDKSPDRLDALVWACWRLFDISGDTPDPRIWSVDTMAAEAEQRAALMDAKPQMRQQAFTAEDEAYFDEAIL